ncbi:hypothetical protein A0H81_05600, partial [Grifola frondosa]
LSRILKEAEVSSVPSFNRFRKAQANLHQQCGVPTLKCQSAQGNIFYMNDPQTIITKDWANPLVRPHIQVYPEIPDGPITEVWHAEKWRKDMDLSLLSPMYDAGNRHFYVNEVAKMCNGQLVIPLRWVTYRGKTHADAFAVELHDNGTASVLDQESIFIQAKNLDYNYLDLQALDQLPHWCTDTVSKGYPTHMPNPDHALAQGDPLYTSSVDHFSDDVSGNHSKSWNKHWNTYMTHRNLPRQFLQQDSPNASITEQFYDFKQIVEYMHYHLSLFSNLRFGLNDADLLILPLFMYVMNRVGMQHAFAFLILEAGGICTVASAMLVVQIKTRKAMKGFTHCSAGISRTKVNVLNELQTQVALACRGVTQPIKDCQTATGMKDAYTQFWIEDLISRAREMRRTQPSQSVQEIQQELMSWVKDNDAQIYNPFLTLQGLLIIICCLDPTQDTPVEILHTILLGIVKYIWYGTHSTWSLAQKQTFALRLQATNTEANYIMQYANSLIGRQLKTVIQATIFHIHDLLWKAVGQLTALLWFPEIADLQQYLADIDVAVANVLDTFAEIDPTKIIQKIKLHLLTHLHKDILRFGPLV